MPTTIYQKTQLLNYRLRGQSYTPPGTLYIGLGAGYMFSTQTAFAVNSFVVPSNFNALPAGGCIDYIFQVTTGVTLTTALSNGSPPTGGLLHLSSLPGNVTSGDTILVVSGTHSQPFTAQANASASTTATTVNVGTGTNANFSYPIGTLVRDLTETEPTWTNVNAGYAVSAVTETYTEVSNNLQAGTLNGLEMTSGNQAGYARVAYILSSTAFTAPTTTEPITVASTAPVLFNAATSNWSTPPYAIATLIFDAATNGNLLDWCPLPTLITVASGQSAFIQTGNLLLGLGVSGTP